MRLRSLPLVPRDTSVMIFIMLRARIARNDNMQKEPRSLMF
jgi:hypothetical protein